LIHPLPAGTAYFLGVVLITMMTGRLMQGKGSLARAVFPFVVHLRWGWHRAERARERGKLWVDALLDGAGEGCLSHLAVEPVRLGPQQREVTAVDSSTIARLRAVRANLVAVGHPGRAHQRRAGLGLVQRVRCGASCQEAVAHGFTDLPPTPRKRLIAVDAGIATKEQFAAATNQDALVGRLRRNCTLRCAPHPPPANGGGGPGTEPSCIRALPTPR
jgi:hypothetical protein